MIVIQCEQGSPEWHRARAGVITASMFSTARQRLKSGPNKGELSEAAKNYAFRLAVERINGEPLDEGFETYAMRRGHELEPMARAEHEVQSGLIVQRAGFITSDDGVFGASADGLIGENSGSEYKCFINPEKLRAFHIDNDASDVAEQVQGCMWLAEREEWHVGLYCPALVHCGRHLWWKVFKRDDEFIAAMEKDLLDFAEVVNDFHHKLTLPMAA
ncbi:lambda exonuclease family protein [Pseudoxanthomonas sp. USHLN014]|uniref:lambda exonuclease family protein n=1 Tax=Pseudoxanthomonas sp. USHLN014 TaxID=3081297 RepID=UPI00301D6F5D